MTSPTSSGRRSARTDSVSTPYWRCSLLRSTADRGPLRTTNDSQPYTITSAVYSLSPRPDPSANSSHASTPALTGDAKGDNLRKTRPRQDCPEVVSTDLKTTRTRGRPNLSDRHKTKSSGDRTFGLSRPQWTHVGRTLADRGRLRIASRR